MFERLIEVREENDLTQEQVSKIIGVERSIISKWENRKELIQIKYLNKYSNYFNVSFDYLAGLSNQKQYKNTNENINLSLIGERIKLVRIKNNISLRKLARVLNTSPSTIHAYENGKVLIRTNFAYDIATKYKVSLDWLCGKTK